MPADGMRRENKIKLVKKKRFRSISPMADNKRDGSPERCSLSSSVSAPVDYLYSLERPQTGRMSDLNTPSRCRRYPLESRFFKIALM